jgi:hypothetical protein
MALFTFPFQIVARKTFFHQSETRPPNRTRTEMRHLLQSLLRFTLAIDLGKLSPVVYALAYNLTRHITLRPLRTLYY